MKLGITSQSFLPLLPKSSRLPSIYYLQPIAALIPFRVTILLTG
jgi:hypothetical protein